MLKLPLADIKVKIQEKAGISDEELTSKINEKLDALSGLVSEEGAAHIIANELGVKLFEETFSGKLQIKNVLAGMRNVELVGKVAQIYDVREFQTERGQGKIATCVLADETGQIRVALWNSQAEKINEVKEGDMVKVKSAYSKDNNGKVEIHLNDNSTFVVNPDGVESIQVQTGITRKKLNELTEQDQDVEILATIVQIFDPKFFEVCPECGKRAREKEGVFVCPAHNSVRPDYGYVMNLFVDDGTHNLRVVLWRNQVQQSLGKSHEELVGMKDNPAAFEGVKTDLLGRIVKIQGRTNKNEAFDRLEFVANRVVLDPDPSAEIAKLDAELKSVKSADGEEKAVVEKEELSVKEKVVEKETIASKEAASTDSKEEELVVNPVEKSKAEAATSLKEEVVKEPVLESAADIAKEKNEAVPEAEAVLEKDKKKPEDDLALDEELVNLDDLESVND